MPFESSCFTFEEASTAVLVHSSGSRTLEALCREKKRTVRGQEGDGRVGVGRWKTAVFACGLLVHVRFFGGDEESTGSRSTHWNETETISWFGWPALSSSFDHQKTTQIRVFPTLIWQNTTLLLEIGLRLVDSVRGLHPFRMFSNSAPLHFWAQLGTLRERKNAQNKNAKIVP